MKSREKRDRNRKRLSLSRVSTLWTLRVAAWATTDVNILFFDAGCRNPYVAGWDAIKSGGHMRRSMARRS